MVVIFNPEDALRNAERLHRDLQRIATAFERIAAVLEDVTDNGRVHCDGKIVTVEDRP